MIDGQGVDPGLAQTVSQLQSWHAVSRSFSAAAGGGSRAKQAEPLCPTGPVPPEGAGRGGADDLRVERHSDGVEGAEIDPQQCLRLTGGENVAVLPTSLGRTGEKSRPEIHVRDQATKDGFYGPLAHGKALTRASALPLSQIGTREMKAELDQLPSTRLEDGASAAPWLSMADTSQFWLPQARATG